MNCKRCGRELPETNLFTSEHQHYCAFCIDVIVLEWEAWQEQPLDVELPSENPTMS